MARKRHKPEEIVSLLRREIRKPHSRRSSNRRMPVFAGASGATIRGLRARCSMTGGVHRVVGAVA